MEQIRNLFNRRRFLLGLAAGVGATAVADAVKGQTTAKAPLVRLANLRSYDKLNRVMALNSAGGKLEVNLEALYSYHMINLDRVYLRTYNGTLVGPTLSMKPGETLHVKLTNELPKAGTGTCPETDHAHMDDPPQGVDVTNLHVHGLHVSPSGNADNVFVQICPDGGSFDYEYKLPDDHPAGTFWYHPHKHGSAAVQVANGMAGALIIRGAIDDYYAKQGIEEKILLFQQIPYSKKADGQYTSEWSDITSPTIEPYTLINGQLKPTITLDAGKVYVWRLIHGGISETIPFSILSGGKPVNYYRTAMDGLTTGTVDTMTAAELAPGNRMDVFVKLPAGTYQLMKPFQPAFRSLNLRKSETAQVLAVIVVKPGTADMPVPTAADMAPFVPKLPTFESGLPVRPIQLGFKNQPDGKGKWQFCAKDVGGNVICEPYNPDHPVVVTLNTSEQWQVLNTDPFNAHPFHIHVNPFQVASIEYDQYWLDYYQKLQQPVKKVPINPADFVWRDTMLIHPCQKVTFNTRFEDFDGCFVMHCHILRHEDEGMMRNVEILPTAGATPSCAAPPPATAGRT